MRNKFDFQNVFCEAREFQTVLLKRAHTIPDPLANRQLGETSVMTVIHLVVVFAGIGI